MKDSLVITCLVLGALSILTQLATSIIIAVKTGKTAIADTNESAWKILLDIIKSLGEKAPLLVGGIVLILIGAIFSGALSATIAVS